MLKAKNINHFEHWSLFLGAFVDRCFGKSQEYLVNAVFTRTVMLINDIFRWNRRFRRTLLDLVCFQSSIALIKIYSVVLFESCQTSGLRTTKKHMIDHLNFDLSRMRDVSYTIASCTKAHIKNWKVTAKDFYVATVCSKWNSETPGHNVLDACFWCVLYEHLIRQQATMFWKVGVRQKKRRNRNRWWILATLELAMDKCGYDL